MRRADKLMPDDAARALLQQGHTVRIATVGADGWPYVVPLLYVCVGAASPPFRRDGAARPV